MLFQFINETHTALQILQIAVANINWKAFFLQPSTILVLGRIYSPPSLMTPENTHILIIPTTCIGTSQQSLHNLNKLLLLLPSKLTSESSLVLSFVLVLKLLQVKSVALQGVNRKDNLADYIQLMKVVRFQAFLLPRKIYERQQYTFI